jgi:hypothetical protein
MAASWDLPGYHSSVFQRGDRQVALLLNTAALQPTLYLRTISISDQALCAA